MNILPRRMPPRRKTALQVKTEFPKMYAAEIKMCARERK